MCEHKCFSCLGHVKALYDLTLRAWQRLPPCDAVSQAQYFPMLSSAGRDLLHSMLSFMPQARITAQQAISHPFFDGIRNSTVECLPPSVVDTVDIESCPLQAESLRALMLQEIHELKREHAATESTTAPTTPSTSPSRPASFSGEPRVRPQPSVRGGLATGFSLHVLSCDRIGIIKVCSVRYVLSQH
jgi:serine/threonine protein kinase